MKRSIINLLLISLISVSFVQVEKINPTGSYILKGKKLKEGEKSEFGEIHVKLITKNKAAISFFYSKGFPSYNSGSFVDTLTFSSNKIIYNYTDQEDSTSNCKLTFTFYKDNVKVLHQADDYNYSCGFGQGVIANVTMKKSSSKEPVIKDFWEE